MTLTFNKYQGTGNDFIMINHLQSEGAHSISPQAVEKICTRHTGIGADGLIILQAKEGYDFEMVYYNSDGQPSTMCGNGGRCAVAFAQKIGAIQTHANFLAVDGPHQAEIVDAKVSLGMQAVSTIASHETFFQLDTGSPHYVTFVDNVNDIKVDQEGSLIRNSPLFKAEGINVNFVQELSNDKLFVRTYERGVEAETLSCGTGVTAAALVQMMRNNIPAVKIETLGGSLSVTASESNKGFTNIQLIGPAEFVFEGTIKI